MNGLYFHLPLIGFGSATPATIEGHGCKALVGDLRLELSRTEGGNNQRQ